ncbi:MAG: Gfo/Idh/MocA family oxidoreductase [Phycisphaerales bacterium]|nr:Gfo/Idh/MocA family oxidoreductase [Phycisphaerales bacterium]
MSSPVPVAVIGVGHMGRHHARLYHEMDGAELVAVVDANAERVAEYANQYGAKALKSIDELPDRVRAVSVAVPTSHHRAIAEPLMRRGMDVLVEKPLAPDIVEAEKMLACARETGRILAVGHTERFNPVVRAISRLDIQPKYIEAQRISPFRFRSADIGVVSDMMIHDIDIILNLVKSKVANVHAVGVAVLGKHEDVANARIEFENGAVANIAGSRLALKTDRRLRVFCETAYLSLDYQTKSGVAITRDANLDIIKMAREKNLDDLSQLANLDFGQMINVEPLHIDDVEPLRAQLESFLDSVVTRSAPVVTAEDGVAAVRLATQIVESINQHPWRV